MIPVQEKMYSFLFLKLKKKYNYLPLAKLSLVTTDRDDSLTWKNKGFVERLQEIATEMLNIHFIKTHCIMHQDVLCKRVIYMTKVIRPVKQNMVNYIKSRGLNQRKFSIILNGLESGYSGLSYLTEERRLSYFTV